MSNSAKKKSKIIKVTNEGVKDNYIEDYETGCLNWTIETFKSLTDIKIISKNEEELIFDIKNIDPSIVNAFRRIIISEVPTMAIERVIINQNTSLIPDEVFAHRLGLVPIKADADDFEDYKSGDELNGKNSMKFELKIKCTEDKKSGKMINSEIYSSDLKFIPQEGQEKNEKFYDKNKKKFKIGLVHDDILLNKLRPGMEIDLECFCVKGIGRVHAKWSPVCTCFYRLISDIQLKGDFNNDEMKELESLCPMKVFEIKNGKLKVGDVRKCTTCRECIRHERYKEKVELGKKSEHYEFHIESVGMYSPESIFLKAIEVMKKKIGFWKNKLHETLSEN